MAGIELPRRISGGGGRRGSGAAPTAADVQQVRIARDPGVRAPSGAFGDGEGLVQAGQSLSNFGGDLAQVGKQAADARRRLGVSSASARAAADLKAFTLDLENDTDYETYGPRFQERAELAFNTYSEGLDATGKAEFRANFEALSLEQAYQVRKRANTLVTDQATADLDTTLDTFANLASNAGTDLEYGEAVAQGAEAITTAVDAGIITAEDGGKRNLAFSSRLDEVTVMREISADPGRAARLLTDPSAFPNLDEKRRQALLDSAISKEDIAQRRASAEADRQDRLAEKRLKAEGEAALKEAYDLIDAGATPTPDQLDALKTNPGVSAAEYRGLLKSLEAEGTVEDDAPTLAYFMPRIHDEDLVAELTQAFDEGQLKPETYRTLVNQNKAALSDNRPASPFKSGRDFIKVALDPGQLGGDPVLRQVLSLAQVSALEDFDNFFEANPDLDRQGAMGQARTLMEQYQNVAFDQMRLALPRPRGYQGSKQDVSLESIDAAESALAAEITAGKLTDDQAAREIEQLNVWKRILVKPGAK